MTRAALTLALSLLFAMCAWLVATASGGLEFVLSLVAFAGFGVAAGWAAARRAT